MKTSTLLSIFALLLAFAVSGQADNVIAFSPDTTSVTVGDTLSLDVTLDATDPVFGYQFDLNYPTFLNFLSATEEGDFFNDGINGIVANVLDSLFGGSPFTSPGTMVNFQFTVVGIGTGSFSLANELLPDDMGNPLEIDPVVPVSITSSAATAPPTAPEPSTTALAILATAFVCWRSRAKPR
jgi:hypothetical protein